MSELFENFTVSILKVNKLIQKIKIHEIKAYGLKSIHIMCCYYLYKNIDGLQANELVKLTLEDKAAISRAIKQLQKKGYVEYNPNVRNAIIKLTDLGIKLSKEILEKSEQAVSKCSVLLKDDERKLFYSTLNDIANNLERYYKSIINNGK